MIELTDNAVYCPAVWFDAPPWLMGRSPMKHQQFKIGEYCCDEARIMLSSSVAGSVVSV